MCLKIAKVHILINRVVGKEIICKRGLRQGDPLSLLLFTWVADDLNIMLTNAVENGSIDDLLGCLTSRVVN